MQHHGGQEDMEDMDKEGRGSSSSSSQFDVWHGTTPPRCMSNNINDNNNFAQDDTQKDEDDRSMS